MISVWARNALRCLLLGCLCVMFAGCGHGGIVRNVVYDDDGGVVLYHGENAGDGTYVADRHGAERVGGDGSAFLSKDGRYVFLVDSTPNSPRWPGNRLVLYNVAEKAGRSDGPIPESLYNPRSLSAKDGWEPALLDVYFESGPAVTLSTGMVKFKEHPPVVTDTRCIHWSPGKPVQIVPQPSGPACLNKEQRTDDKDSWVLVRQPDGRNPFRTVWVRPDGSVVELLRSSQGFGATAFCVIAFPFFFWSPSYYRMGGYLTEANRADPATLQAEEPRLQSLIARRKTSAGASGGHVQTPSP